MFPDPRPSGPASQILPPSPPQTGTDAAAVSRQESSSRPPSTRPAACLAGCDASSLTKAPPPWRPGSGRPLPATSCRAPSSLVATSSSSAAPSTRWARRRRPRTAPLCISGRQPSPKWVEISLSAPSRLCASALSRSLGLRAGCGTGWRLWPGRKACVGCTPVWGRLC